VLFKNRQPNFCHICQKRLNIIYFFCFAHQELIFLNKCISVHRVGNTATFFFNYILSELLGLLDWPQGKTILTLRMRISGTSPHFCWPEREETDGNDTQYNGAAGQVVVPGRRVVQPHVGIIT
jgi:hypothetical protein